jgi:hypothetical protein
MGGVMNEKDLEAKVMRHQVSVEDVVALVPSDIIEEQMQAGENVGETSIANVDRIEMDLERTILMIEEQ